MKRLFLVGLLFISSLVASAHGSTQQCSIAGWYTYTWTDLGSSTSVRIIRAHYADTTIALGNTTTFRADLGEEIIFQFNDGFTTTFKTSLPCTLNLPITYRPGTFQGQYADGTVTFKWDVDMESNVDYYEVLDSNGVAVAHISSMGNTSIPRTYSTLVNYAASFGSGFLIGLFILGLVFGFRKRKIIPIAFMFGVISLVSCAKTNNRVISKGTTRAVYSLNETDKDGVTNNIANCIVNIN
jgi:hypothetical protein